MAKVMISIPDPLLERVDAHVSAAGETRSGFLQRLAERELSVADAGRQRELKELLARATSNMGGRGAQMIREDRESH